MRNRGKLLVLAQERVHETGYTYRKGKSRSKSYGSGIEEATCAKHIKITVGECTDRIKAIKEELYNLKDRVSFKHKRLEAAESSKNYKLCDQLSEEVGELNKTRHLLELEMKVLEKKESKSQRYYKSRSRRESDSDSSSSISSAFFKQSPLLSPPVKSATPRLISPPPVTVNAPSTSGYAQSKSTSSSEQMGISYQARSSEQQYVDLTGEQAQEPVLQEQEDAIDLQSVSANDETLISQPTVSVSDDDQTQEHVELDANQSF